jgi:hypothetical protein
MSEENNEYIAHLWYEVMWSEPKLEVADEIVHPDYAPEWIHIDKKGPEQIKHEIKYFRSVFPDLKYTIVESTALPDRVWIRYKAKGHSMAQPGVSAYRQICRIRGSNHPLH